jgi:hypothetical protein
MAFGPLIASVVTHHVVEADHDQPGHVVTVPISWCDVTHRLCSLEARLSPFTYQSEPMAEFEFSIVVASADGSEPPFMTQDRFVAAPYIPDAARPFIMLTTCHALRALVLDVRPDRIYRVAKEIGAHGKALKKHELLTDELLGLGYMLIDAGTDRIGRPYWLMGR